MSWTDYSDPRRSFAAKLVVALLATVGLLLAVMLVVVRAETAGQVELVAERTADRARQAFADSEARRREQLARRAAVLTDTRRAFALLEDAIETGDIEHLTGQLRYGLNLTQFDSSSLTVVTDAFGAAIVTLMGEAPLEGADPAGVEVLARSLLDSFDSQLTAYRVVDGRLFTVQVVLLELGGRVVGTTALGLPIRDEDAEALGRLVDAEVCFVAGGRCVAGSALARAELAPLLVALEGTTARAMTDWRGERWELMADPLVEGEDQGWMVMAVPLEAVLAPFDRIRRALALASLAALALALVTSVLLSRGLTRPVRALVDATRRVARGDYETRVAARGRDEVGQLARAFNAMTEGLELKEQYRGVLDKVVSREVAEELLKGEVRLGGENREVSVLFADVRGFTGLTEGMEPQEVIGLLNQTMERLSAAVEEAGGVVDKYVGDEIMAVFGAPLAQPDHAARAVAASKAMQRSIAAMDEERSRRGDPPVAIGVGVHSGVVVAGNMGSPNRLNYTVLGESVNLAARLCSVAAPGEILISQETRARLGPEFEVQSMGERALKGFSRPIPLYSVQGGAPAGEASGLRWLARVVAVALASAGAFGPAAAGAQELPTLEALGIGYISPGGAVQLDLSGRVDLEAYAPAGGPAWIIPDTEPFGAARLRLFGDLFLGDRAFAATELRIDRGPEPTAGPTDVRLEQLFVRLVGPGRTFAQAGRFVAPLGSYPSRHHTVDDPLIRPPLMYEYRTMVSAELVPANSAVFVGWKDDPDQFRAIGAPPVWGAPYPWGVLAGLSAGPAAVELALLNSAPSSEPDQWTLAANPFDRPTWQGVARYAVRPEVTLQLFHSRGPYLESAVLGAMPAGATAADFGQVIWGGEILFQRGHTTGRIEAMHDRWEVPNVPDDPIDVSYSIEARQRFGRGLALAARFGAIHFNRISAAGPDYDGTTVEPVDRWDYDARRVQLGASYRIVRNMEVRAEHGWTWTAAPHDEDARLASIQLWWAF